MTDGRTFAIGDIHGCSKALRALVAALDLQANDTLVLLGDVIDRGPDSRNVLDQLLELQAVCQLVPILGNHEEMMLGVIDGKIPLQDWLVHGGAETLDSYAKDATPDVVPAEHVEFIRGWGNVHETTTHFFIHGNYYPEKSLTEQPYEKVRWQSLDWFMPKPHVSGRIAIVGHTANRQGRIVNRGHLVCIDTYCYGGGPLTALEPATERVWQASESGDVREGKLPPVGVSS